MAQDTGGGGKEGEQSTMTHYQISQALLNHLRGMASLPPILYENAPSLKGASKFIMVSDISAATQLDSFCYNETKSGLYQVSLLMERDTGTFDTMTIIDNIINHFKYRTIDGISITSAYQNPSITTDKHYQKSVTINYTYTG